MREPQGGSYKRNALISLAAFLGSIALVYHPQWFDIPLTRAVNSLANRDERLDLVFFDFANYTVFSGTVLVCFIWFCWFENDNLERRTRIAVGTLASFGAGVISRVFQHALSSHPRPYYDATLGFHRPSVNLSAQLNTWNSFPSDHVAVFAGLVVVIWIANRRLGLFSMIWTVVVESSRTYVGAHYPTDLIGGAALAATVIWISQAPVILSWGRPLSLRARLSPSVFYMCAFFMTFQIATLFLDLRGAADGFIHHRQDN